MLARGSRMQAMLVALLLVLAVLAMLAYAKSAHILLGAEAYVYGYPLVIVDVTRANADKLTGARNQLLRVRRFPDARFKDVVRPNVDTLYTSAFIDMQQGPWVFEMAPNTQRYEVMPFLDAWTNVFASPGTRTNGTQGARYLLAGRLWQGEVPAGLTLLRAPTDLVWLIGRTQTNGAGDYSVVHGLQDGVTLRSLADWQAGKPASAPPPRAPAGVQNPEPPIRQMRAMDVSAFFTRLASLMVDNPPAASDAAMLSKLARIGIKPGHAPEWNALDRWAVALGRWLADRNVARELGRRPTLRGWVTPPSMLGNYGEAYSLRAVVAMIGLGANLPADAMYPSAALDGAGAPLHGDHRYRIHFARDALPPVQAFWSITAYGADDFFIDNPLGRYALGDRDPLVYNPDGSLDLLVQAEAPSAAQLRNWLPVRAGEPFLLNARLYWPRAAALDGSWSMPAVERIDPS